MVDFVLFGTEGCHLCEEAATLLNEACMTFEHRDILERPDWQEKYGWLIPVLWHERSGQQLNWPFDERQVQAFAGLCLAAEQNRR